MRFILAAILTVLISLPASSLEVPEYFKKAWAEDPANALCTMQPYKYVRSRDSKAPFAYKPFYISHYGRHGSRSGWAQDNHGTALFTLEKAHMAGQLTPEGEALLETVEAVIKTHANMDGRLTPRGAQEHRQIAKRMVRRFPRVFRAGRIYAVSSETPRCIISMEAALGEIRTDNPNLSINADCGPVLQKYVSSSNYDGCRQRVHELRDSIRSEYMVPADAFMAKVFKDPDSVRDMIKSPESFRASVWKTINAAPGMDLPYRDAFALFTEEEGYFYMSTNDYYNYFYQANSIPLGDARMPRVELLVNDIVDKADAAIAQRCCRKSDRKVLTFDMATTGPS